MSDMPDKIWVHKQSEVISSVKPAGLMSSLYDEYTRTALLTDMVNSQAEDEGLWFEAQTAPEAYLQQELRKLHALIEDTPP